MAKDADVGFLFSFKEIFISDVYHCRMSWIIHPTKWQSRMLLVNGWEEWGTAECPRFEIRGFGGKKCT